MKRGVRFPYPAQKWKRDTKEKFINRNEFLKIFALTTVSLFTARCGRRSDQEFAETGENIESGRITILNNWIYPIGFNQEIFDTVLRDFGLPFPSQKPVDILLTNETQAYETEYAIQSHIVSLSEDETPDKIKISCGRYIEEVKRWTGKEPQTIKDELFLSVALSSSILNGLVDLAVDRGNISIVEANVIAHSFADRLTQGDISNLIFTRVFLFESYPQELES